MSKELMTPEVLAGLFALADTIRGGNFSGIPGFDGMGADDRRRLTGAQAIERLANGYARGGYDNSALGERGIRGIFYQALEVTFDVTWASRVGIYLNSDALTEKHRWLGQTPGFRERFGGILAKGLNDYEIQITNKDFEATVKMSIHDWRRDKTGHFVRRLGELALRANNLWEELLVTSLEANPTAYDEVAYFSTTHSFGDSGTLSNDLSNSDLPALNVTTPARPTREEAGAILTQAAAHFFSFKDDKGKKANQGARSFLVVTPPAMAPGFIQAVGDQLYQQGGSNLLGSLGWMFDVVPEPLLSNSDKAYMFRTDGLSSKPYILQEEDAPRIDMLGEGSEHAKKTEEILAIGKCTRAVGPGEWQHALRLTLS